MKCGQHGEDRRTLYMSCWYAMEELGVPFEQLLIQGGLFPLEGFDEWSMHPDDSRYPKHKIPRYSKTPSNSKFERGFYTLRVCKSCRSSWMTAIKNWFNTPDEEVPSCGSGIFVREYGKIVEITPEEWERRRKLAAETL